jgi:hypothetical protein
VGKARLGILPGTDNSFLQSVLNSQTQSNTNDMSGEVATNSAPITTPPAEKLKGLSSTLDENAKSVNWGKIVFLRDTDLT